MAKADSVPSSSRQLITGESANQSTNPRAVTLPALSVQPVDRQYFIGSSDPGVITDTDEALVFWIWWKRHIELKDSSNCHRYAASTGQEPLDSNIGALSFETVGFLFGRLLRNILILLRFRSRNKHLRFSAFGASLVPSKPQGRLR